MDQRDFGGTGWPAIIVRLLVISLIVGIVLSALGINANNLLHSINVLARRVYDLGFGSIEWLLQYVLLGAMVVVPISLVAWLLGAFRARRH